VELGADDWKRSITLAVKMSNLLPIKALLACPSFPDGEEGERLVRRALRCRYEYWSYRDDYTHPEEDEYIEEDDAWLFVTDRWEFEWDYKWGREVRRSNKIILAAFPSLASCVADIDDKVRPVLRMSRMRRGREREEDE
jgi:hypothetical protein